MTTAAVILAAGGGTRFATTEHKLVTLFRGRPLIVWAVEHALAAGLDETVVITGAADLAPLLPPGARAVHNPDWQSGQAGSLQVAIADARGAGHEAVVVGLGDQPLIPAAAWQAVTSSEGQVAVATYGGRRANPVRLAATIWSLLPVSGDAGARVLMAERPDLVVEVACEGEFADVDTVEDLERWS
jgi:molybdenum cofactor cytidylyltransferase